MEFSREFIGRLKAGDTEAFDMLYRETVNELLSYIQYRVRGSEHDAEDLLSDVFHDAIVYVGSLTLTHNVASWLYSIVKSKVADFYRKKKRENKIFVVRKNDVSEENILDVLAGPPDTEVIREEEKLIATIAFSRLPAEYRKILEAKYDDDKSVTEIARDSGKSEKSIESILFRGRKLLEKELANAAREKIYFVGEGG